MLPGCEGLGAGTGPVSLAQAKSDPRLADMVLVRNSRLSVQPVTESEWNAVLDLARRPG